MNDRHPGGARARTMQHRDAMSVAMSKLQMGVAALRRPVARPEVDLEIESYQKSLVTRYVLPIMSGMSLLYYVAHFDTSERKLLAMGFCLLVTFANIFLTSRNRRLKIGPLELWSRSDVADALRWTFNLLVADVMLAVVFEPNPASFLAAWLICVLSAQADTFRRRHRVWVVAVGLLTGAGLLTYLYPTLTIAEYLLIVFCMTGIVVMVGVMESYWVREITAKSEARRSQVEAHFEAQRLRRDALVGGHLRTVSHELNNILGLMDLSTSLSGDQIGKSELAIMRRAVDYAKKITTLVLGDIDANVPRDYAVRDLLDDVSLLLGKEVRRRRLSWVVETDPAAEGAIFRERAGSTYFIVHNLVKNAWESLEGAVAAGSVSARIGVKVGIPAAGLLELSITDNGPGMDEATRQTILAGRAATTKAAGHGLGLRFVLEECQRNGFALAVESKAGKGTAFRLTIPRTVSGD